MSNISYRMLEAQRAEVRARRLASAKQLLAQTEAATPQAAKFVEGLVSHFYVERGGKELEVEIETCETLMKAGNLSRAYEINVLTENIQRQEKGIEPVKPEYKAPVSASVHLGAVRDHSKFSHERRQVIDDAKIDAAQTLEHAKHRENAQEDRAAREDSVPGGAALVGGAPEPVQRDAAERASAATPAHSAVA